MEPSINLSIFPFNTESGLVSSMLYLKSLTRPGNFYIPSKTKYKLDKKLIFDAHQLIDSKLLTWPHIKSEIPIKKTIGPEIVLGKKLVMNPKNINSISTIQ